VTAGSLPTGLSLTNSNGRIGPKATAYGAYNFTITATNSDGCTGSSNYTVLVSLATDTAGPSVTITNLKNNAVIQTNAPINVLGKVTDNVQATNIIYWLNVATNTTPLVASYTAGAPNWSLAIPSPLPVNTLYVAGVDLSGNTGKVVSVTFNYGTHTFFDQAGIYYGLFSPSGGVDYEDSGFAKITVKAVAGKLPSFSVNLIVDGRASGWGGAGTFTLDGVSHLNKPISRAKQTDTNNVALPELALSLQLPLTGDGSLTGTVASATTTVDSGAWTANLESHLCVTNTKVPVAGTAYDGLYTVAVSSPAADYGDGYAALVITNGKPTLKAGKLANGQTFAGAATIVNGNGDWALFSKGDTLTGVYKSLAMGWVSIDRSVAIQTNSLVWISKGGAQTKTYTAGFTNDVDLLMSKYVPVTAGGIVLDATKAFADYTAVFTNLSDLVTNITNPVVVSNSAAGKNKIIDSLASKTNKANFLSLPVSTATGIIAGGVIKGDGETQWSVNGVVLQGATQACGYFIETKDAPGVKSGQFLIQ
jgi:hypothetical protein